ncbi:flavin containing amine oxidase [Penicillium brasilianum]|uniref:Flavin containing amine oxidase n=1 Tax=Penicillium brasilianum TaxID=104259 RepID=A0A1S9RDG4_PENBI|nr:flavin containing amine oxidase [Penicillium brasilianum]
MEAKAHSKESYTKPGQVSWMDQDLADCSRDFRPLSQERDAGTSLDGLSRAKDGPALHVGVIGAGFAGLRCAEILLDHGVRVTVLEARDRLGGRVHQVDLLGHTVDMGPNWIHGTLNNPILNLAKQTETALAAVEDSACIFDQDGEVISNDKATELLDLVWEIIREAFKYSNEDCANISPERNLKDFFLDQVREKGLAEEDQTLVLQMAEMWGAFIGDPLERQSLKYFWLEECLDGDNLYVASSHAKILDKVASAAIKRAEILLSTKVVNIENMGSPEGDKRKVRVTSSENQSWEFDDVVVTIPLGALKCGTPNFNPPLSPAMTRAIQNTSYSRLEKVYITFPTAFWESSGPDSDSDTSNTSPSNSTKSPFQSFANFLNPTYSPTSNPSAWSLEVNSLSNPSTFDSHAQPTLLFGIYGPCATHITTLIKELSPSSPEYFSVIDDFFRPYYALLPKYDPTKPECRPRAVLATNWQNDEFAGFGSYMNFKNNLEPKDGGHGERTESRLDDDIRALRKGMPERGIWLAGDHTAPFVALGTLTGAYWSGELAGMRILKGYGMALESKGGEESALINGEK